MIVVTKGDLVPRADLLAWLDYLRTSTGLPVLSLMKRVERPAAKSITHGKVGGQRGMAPVKTKPTFVKPIGFKTLVKVMQSFNFKGKIAVVGYPLTGKHMVASAIKSPQMNLSKKTKVEVASLVEREDLNIVTAGNVDLLFGGKPQASKQPLLVLKRFLERCPSTRELRIQLALPEFQVRSFSELLIVGVLVVGMKGEGSTMRWCRW